MNSKIISYIVFMVVTIVACIEHAVFNLYPTSTASSAIDDTFAYLVIIAGIAATIEYAKDYYKNLKQRREENKINK